jgi:hypothetical protein
MALTDSLDELITSGAITPQLAMKVLQQACGFSVFIPEDDDIDGMVMVSLINRWLIRWSSR